MTDISTNMAVVTLAAALLLAGCKNSSEVTADYNVIPLPHEIIVHNDEPAFLLDDNTVIAYNRADSSAVSNAAFLSDYIRNLTGLEIETGADDPQKHVIRLADDLVDSNLEAYTISVTADSIIVRGASAAGTFYGIQTLRKSIPAPLVTDIVNVRFPAAEITDAPRFSYRGAHLDCARHFFDPDSVKIFIDMLALHNMNRFHWHLTDDQGWRIEIKSHPGLTDKGQWRSGTVIGAVKEGENARLNVYDSIPYGGFYTQNQVRDIVDYAARRHITVIPEIDMPGHMQAALATYPQLGCTGGPYEVWRRWGVSDDVLCAGNDSVYRFIDDVLGEIVELFPGEYVHIGGDECPKSRWENCPKCQAKIRKLGLTSDSHATAEQKLQTCLMAHAASFLKNHGRKIIGWNEMIEGGLPEGAVVMSWVGINGAVKAAREGHDAILTPYDYLYFDFPQADQSTEPQAAHWGHPITVEDVYRFNPAPEELTSDELSHIAGVQGNLWSEYVPTMSHAQYMVLPRMAALAEVQWGASQSGDYEGFVKRLDGLRHHYDANGYNYCRHIFEK